ncbi:MAG: putative RND superfamily exporter protein, partial [Paraglaciecola psychrophila]
MKLQLFSFYERVILNNPRASLLLMLLLVAGLSTYIPSFKLDASADSLVLEGDQALQYSRQISQRYASEEFLLVTYKPQKELLSDESLHSLDQLRAELSVLEGVSSITSILDVPLLESPLVTLSDIAGGGELRTLRIADIDREMVLAELTTSPIYRDLIMSSDGKTTAVQINLANDEKLESLFASRELLREQARLAGFSQHDALATAELDYGDYAAQVNQRREQLVATVRAIIERYRSDAQMFLGGVPMIAADMVSFVKNDLVVFGAGIVSFMILVLGLIFRRVVWVVLPLISCVVSTAFMLGLITWLDWR